MTNIKLHAKDITLKNMDIILLEFKSNRVTEVNGQLQNSIIHAMIF